MSKSKSTTLNAKIDRLMSKFTNSDHKEQVKEYILIRKRIDKTSLKTIELNIISILALSKFLKDKPFKSITQEDMLSFEEYLENTYQSDWRGNKKGLAQSTIMNYEASIKRFYKYITNKKQYRMGKQFQKSLSVPDSVSWMTTTKTNHHQFPIDKIMTEEELLHLINSSFNFRDKSAIVSLYDAGLRISELCALNIESVGFDKLGAYFILPKDGENLKTGTRKVRLFLLQSSPTYLKNYLANHPFSNYQKSPLFLSLFHPSINKVKAIQRKRELKESDLEILRLTPSGFYTIFMRICKFANIKNITPHTLRHNSATRCAKLGFNEMELRIRYGWSPTSTMPSKYVHLASKDMDDKIKIITGFKEPEEIEPSKLNTILCWNCQSENVPTNNFCSTCGAKLDRKQEDITATDLGLMIQHYKHDPEFSDGMIDKMTRYIEEYHRKHH